METEPVVVWEATNLLEAQIVKGRLESEGIPALIRGEAVGSIYGFTAGNLARADVLVPAPLAERAGEILSAPVEADGELIEEDDEGLVGTLDSESPEFADKNDAADGGAEL